MNDVYRIFDVTLIIQKMKRSCNFYSQIPGFKLVYGGSSLDSFTIYQIGKGSPPLYLNLELNVVATNKNPRDYKKRHFGRIIFHTEMKM
ncbi:MAG: hypothetical protein M3Z01_07035 [Thermoproteota archaeon]|nr:hypothetical protein [Thermoproteota archaeon]